MNIKLGDIIAFGNQTTGETITAMVVVTPEINVYSEYIAIYLSGDKSPLAYRINTDLFFGKPNGKFYDFPIENVTFRKFELYNVKKLRRNNHLWNEFQSSHSDWYEKIETRRCCICNCVRPISEIVKTNSKKPVCYNCVELQSYWTKNNKTAGAPTKNSIRYGFELECVPKNYWNVVGDEVIAKTLCENKDIVPTRDGSLPDNGVEFKTPIMNNLKYAKSLLNKMSKYWDFSDEKCGQHINISIPEFTEDVRYYALKKHRCFDFLAEDMEAHCKETITVCGRYFTHYASRFCDYQDHRNWINLSHNGRAEFRLSKISSVNQYIALAQMWAEILKAYILFYNEDIAVDRNTLYNTSARTKKHNSLDIKYGRKMIRIFHKYYKKISEMT